MIEEEDEKSISSRETMNSELERRKSEEYEMQLFGFHSRAAFETLSNVVHEKIQRNCKKLCGTLKDKKSNEWLAENNETLKNNEESLVKLYSSAAVPHLKKIESIVRKYISVPPNVLADEDKVQRTQYSDEEFESIKRKLEDLQDRAKKATIMKAALEEESRIQDKLSTFEDDVNRLSNILSNASECLDINSEAMIELIETYNELRTNFDILKNTSQKEKYNNIDELQ